jgi:hypothetical protein
VLLPVDNSDLITNIELQPVTLEWDLARSPQLFDILSDFSAVDSKTDASSVANTSSATDNEMESKNNRSVQVTVSCLLIRVVVQGKGDHNTRLCMDLHDVRGMSYGMPEMNAVRWLVSMDQLAIWLQKQDGDGNFHQHALFEAHMRNTLDAMSVLRDLEIILRSPPKDSTFDNAISYDFSDPSTKYQIVDRSRCVVHAIFPHSRVDIIKPYLKIISDMLQSSPSDKSDVPANINQKDDGTPLFTLLLFSSQSVWELHESEASTTKHDYEVNFEDLQWFLVRTSHRTHTSITTNSLTLRYGDQLILTPHSNDFPKQVLSFRLSSGEIHLLFSYLDIQHWLGCDWLINLIAFFTSSSDDDNSGNNDNSNKSSNNNDNSNSSSSSSNSNKDSSRLTVVFEEVSVVYSAPSDM